jgi:hypothetical protein
VKIRALAAQGEAYMDADELCGRAGQEAERRTLEFRIAVLRNNALIETDGRRYRSAALFRK